jgi:hypothetical protein
MVCVCVCVCARAHLGGLAQQQEVREREPALPAAGRLRPALPAPGARAAARSWTDGPEPALWRGPVRLGWARLGCRAPA